MKRIWIAVLSFLFLYGGVAWAIAACLHDDRHPDHPPFEHHSNLQVFGDHGDSRNPPTPVIHCPPVSQHVGPAVRLALAEIPRADKDVALHADFLPGALSVALEKELWLEAPFKRLVTFSLPVEPARHLFLSVLQV
jgi:hypothetical protein